MLEDDNHVQPEDAFMQAEDSCNMIDDTTKEVPVMLAVQSEKEVNNTEPTNSEDIEPMSPPCIDYNWSAAPRLLCTATKEELYSGKIPPDFMESNFTPALTVKEGGLVYDTCWYPFMNSWQPASCCFLSTSKESPAYLWDAFTGELRATYRPYNQHDFPNMIGLVSCIPENPIMPGLVAMGTYSKCIGLYKDVPSCTFKTVSGVTQVEFSSCGTKLFSACRKSRELLC
ncbi:hypothetical protein DMN91_007354 [Ooceraea biroi]|uniref:Telomerase Cajal body protein n=1 Tax=Ooceraea biroi TaxID=2015173 RepID=A0A3L8DK45_OOCBI|nr:hypothetical protein DMN91_007354 [Ooceraea biroi]